MKSFQRNQATDDSPDFLASPKTAEEIPFRVIGAVSVVLCPAKMGPVLDTDAKNLNMLAEPLASRK